MNWKNFLKGFGIGLLIFVIVWVFLWIFKAVLDFAITILGTSVGFVLGLGGPILLVLILCAIFGYIYMKRQSEE